MSTALTKLMSGAEDTIDVSEVMCPICLSILIEPVKMPCTHVICMSCFSGTVNHASLCCPICKMRISTWCRRASKTNSLVDSQLWLFIQKKFAGNVAAHMAGLDEEDVDDMFPCLPMHQFASQGAIKSEFDLEINRVMEEQKRVREEEERLSAELAEQMLEEERKALEIVKEQERKDQELAREMWANTPPAQTPSSRILRSISAQQLNTTESKSTAGISKNKSVLEMIKSNNNPKTLFKTPVKENRNPYETNSDSGLQDGHDNRYQTPKGKGKRQVEFLVESLS